MVKAILIKLKEIKWRIYEVNLYKGTFYKDTEKLDVLNESDLYSYRDTDVKVW